MTTADTDTDATDDSPFDRPVHERDPLADALRELDTVSAVTTAEEFGDENEWLAVCITTPTISADLTRLVADANRAMLPNGDGELLIEANDAVWIEIATEDLNEIVYAYDWLDDLLYGDADETDYATALVRIRQLEDLDSLAEAEEWAEAMHEMLTMLLNAEETHTA